MYMCHYLSFISNGKRIEGKSKSEPDTNTGNLAVQDRKVACGNKLHGLITICYKVGDDGYRGSYRPKTSVCHISISNQPCAERLDVAAILKPCEKPPNGVHTPCGFGGQVFDSIPDGFHKKKNRLT